MGVYFGQKKSTHTGIPHAKSVPKHIYLQTTQCTHSPVELARVGLAGQTERLVQCAVRCTVTIAAAAAVLLGEAAVVLCDAQLGQTAGGGGLRRVRRVLRCVMYMFVVYVVYVKKRGGLVSNNCTGVYFTETSRPSTNINDTTVTTACKHINPHLPANTG